MSCLCWPRKDVDCRVRRVSRDGSDCGIPASGGLALIRRGLSVVRGRGAIWHVLVGLKRRVVRVLPRDRVGARGGRVCRID